MSLRFACAGFIALIGLVMTGSSASAAFQVQIRVDGGPAFIVQDQDANDDNGSVNRIIFGEGLAALIPNFEVVGEIATTNLPGTGLSALLSSNISVRRTGSGASTIEILASATGFFFPGGDILRLTSTTSGTFTEASLGSPVVSQSFAAANNALNGMTVSPGPEVFVNGNIESDSFSTPQPRPFVVFADLLRPFSITNLLRITLGNVGAEVDATVQSRVTAGLPGDNPVPEPGSLALLALGGMGLIGRAVQRRRAKAV